jgi:hypothetical protein
MAAQHEQESRNLTQTTNGPSILRDDFLQMYALPGPDIAVWGDYAHIFNSPWFNRTWVLQEIVFARQAVVSMDNLLSCGMRLSKLSKYTRNT